MKIYYVDGEFIPADQAMIPVDDLAILRGFGICDIMRTYKGKPFLLPQHISRLENSAKEIGLSLPWSARDISRIILTTLEKNQPLDEVNIRIIITGGSSTDFFYPQGHPRLIILVTDMAKLPLEWYEKGIKVITRPEERSLPDAKVISYIPAAMALKKAEKKGAVEAIYINHNKEVLEGTTSNLFAFFHNVLATPRDGILKGITRQAVLSIAKKEYKVEERPIKLTELLTANEVFITGTNKCVVPVVQIDDTPIGNGKPGRNTKQIIAKLENQTLAFIEK